MSNGGKARDRRSVADGRAMSAFAHRAAVAELLKADEFVDLVIPRGVMHRFKWRTEDNRALVVESASPVLTPKRYRNHFHSANFV